MSFLSFFRTFLSDWKQTGSVIPSSPSLVKAMLRPIDFSSTDYIVELGPGTGVITKEILKRIHPNAQLLIIESNQTFCKILGHYKDSRLKVICTSALNIEKYCTKKPDIIISGIPLSNIPRSDRIMLLQKISRVLSERGQFIQFQYSLGLYRILNKVFPKVYLSFVALNVPPAFIYGCHKRKPSIGSWDD